MMGAFKIFALTFGLLVLPQSNGSLNEYLLKTQNGIVKGFTQLSRYGQEMLAFTGIPFAEPPIGENRFRAPIPKKPWTGIYDATKLGPICPQASDDWSDISEDCLWLNVFTKNLTAKQPVLVWIFGGGMISGNAGIYDPTYLLDRDDVVFVSIQYRLGALGFLSTGDANAPGNSGFKDQNLALKWVRENIRSFGGNPELVTLVGQSSGGFSVSSQILSPKSKGLFHRAIAQSEYLTLASAYDLSFTTKVAQNLSCPLDSSELIAKCLRSKTAKEIVDVSDYKVYSYTIEDPSSAGAFLTEDPFVLLAEGRYNRVPMITGHTKNDTFADHLGDLIQKVQDVYRYEFSYVGRYTKGDYDDDGKPLGQFHGDDLIYLFHTFRFPRFEDSDPESYMVQEITGWWTQFAKTGNPNNPEDPWIKNIKWLPSNDHETNILIMN